MSSNMNDSANTIRHFLYTSLAGTWRAKWYFVCVVVLLCITSQLCEYYVHLGCTTLLSKKVWFSYLLQQH